MEANSQEYIWHGALPRWISDQESFIIHTLDKVDALNYRSSKISGFPINCSVFTAPRDDGRKQLGAQLLIHTKAYSESLQRYKDERGQEHPLGVPEDL